MKAIYLTGIGMFWTAIVILGVAGLLSYENRSRDITQTTDTPGTSTAETTTEAVAGGETLWTESIVAGHSAVNDCWIIVNGGIFNVTEYVPFHPGGTNAIRPWCGRESTQAFTIRGENGEHSNSAWSQLEKYYLAKLGATVPASVATSASTPAPTADTISPVSNAANPYETALQEEYPEAVIVSINVEDDGRAEVKFVYEGDVYKAKLDTSYNITKVELED